ncbi:CopG family antitoxin [Thioflexithrix psekupsensis]|uniref:Uncharacterized protein n=1 Tax=Thioflexithrix psekupsensis TaxID=1570016 RepID=A0A251X9E9_9GAMM|nr:hypothetical protein [Thioflexithrix psekupsensis]OUD14357.1 hypothetical protein TPSD3_08550 [Thioflexithrix psekupsensis]
MDKSENTINAWDTGKLGEDEAFAKVATDVDEVALNYALNLHPISIRLQKNLVEDLKKIAQSEGIGYQPLIRQILTRFVKAKQEETAQQTLLRSVSL